MSKPSAHEVTQLLHAWSQGDEHALEKLTPLVYQGAPPAAPITTCRENDRAIPCKPPLWSTKLICAWPDPGGCAGRTGRTFLHSPLS